MKKKIHSSWRYILFLELWVLPVRKNSEIAGALLFGRRMRVLFLSIEASSRSIFPLNKTISLIYSHFVQTIPTLRRNNYLIDHNISCAILELSSTIPELADKVRILTLRKTIPELYRFVGTPSQTHRPTFINKRTEVKNNVAFVHSYHAGKAFCLSSFINFGKIFEKWISQHHYDYSRRNYIIYIKAEVGDVISVYLHIPMFKIGT